MAITYDDVKLMQSQLLDDSDDGGGYMTGTEVIDGNVNNLFPDKSRLDMVYGRVSLRKAFLAILSNTVDTYYGSHVILTQQAVDPRVHVCMFSTDSMTDVRTAAQTYIENYVVPSILFVGQLIGTHLEGSMAVMLAQRLDRAAPVAGDVFQLIEGVDIQYIKLLSVDSEVQSFWDAGTQTSFDMNVITCEIGTALEYTFHGPEVTRGAVQGNVAVYTTKVADTSKYYSISPLTEDLGVGDSILSIESIWVHLVPSAQSESVIADEYPTEETSPVIPDGTTPVGVTLGTLTIGDGGSLFLSHGLQRGSLNLIIAGLVYHDDETGIVLDASEVSVGTINYGTGEIIFSSAKSGAASVTYLPAGSIGLLQNSDAIEITLSNRALNYVHTLIVDVNPGTLVVDYMAQGRWYTLRDSGETDVSGKGFLIPDISGTGSGTITRSTNTVVVTLGALPDVGSKILYRWGEGYLFSSESGSPDFRAPAVIYNAPEQRIDPSTLIITWGGGAKSASDPLGDGNITGDATGKVSYGGARVEFMPTAFFSKTESFSYAYDYTDPTHGGTSDTPSQGNLPWNFTLDTMGGNIGANSVYFQMSIKDYGWAWNPVLLRIKDDGAGNLVVNGNQLLIGGGTLHQFKETSGRFIFVDGTVVGDINYVTGVCNVTTLPYTTYWFTYEYSNGGVCTPIKWCRHSSKMNTIRHDNENRNAQSVFGAVTSVYYHYVGATSSVAAENVVPDGLHFNLIIQDNTKLTPGSVIFTFNDLHFYSSADGKLYHSIDPMTSLGTLAGTIDYTTGKGVITDWGASGVGDWSVSIKAMVGKVSEQGLGAFVFRTQGAPLRPSSFQISGTLMDGTAVNATAAVDGTISDVQIEGELDNTTGLVWITFGEWVPIAQAETEDWYNPNSNQGGNSWKPNYVQPETLKYNCVVYKYIPLDPSLLGLDPTRLPSDGRVPAFRNGFIVVVHNTLYETCPAPLSAGQVITLPRHPVSLIEMYDQDDIYVPKTYYSEDLENGTITMADPLDLSPFTEPLVAMHRIEDMCLVSDVQINGTLAVVAPVTNAYPKDTSYVSGVLPYGDKKARYHHLFDQYTWTGEWSDYLIGAPCTANYNDIDFPFELTNKGATTERWMLQFDSATHFFIIGETLGQIGDGYITNDCHPVNPATSADYFMIRLGGWGSGWVSGNVLRFNTDGARAPIWFCRTTLQGPSTEPEDKFTTQLRGDAD